MDGRRHSVDVPISRTLVALRRVRSLRDPSTHSMSKLSPLIDTLVWETNPENTFTLGFDGLGGDKSYNGSKERDSEMVGEIDTVMGNYHDEYDDKSWCDEPDESLNQNEKTQNNSHLRKSYKETDVDVLSFLRSPCLYSIGKTRKKGPSNGFPLYKNEDFCFTGSCHQGCGISSCWSRTKRYRDSTLINNDDVPEEQPLLLASERTYLDKPRNLCQKFMPKSFADLVGQRTVATSLLNAISKNQISSMYIFHGPAGTGKTSASRIFAAALNCDSPGNLNTPCSSCRECSLIFSGRSRDFHELDPLRINKIEQRKSLVGSMWAPPISSRFKVYVVDECHLLLGEWWAGLLGWLDRLPRNIVFVMLTSNLDKVPYSVVARSRVQRFQSVKEADIVGRLVKISAREGIEFEENALSFIASKSGGSVRDAEMMLDQLSLLGQRITVSLVHEVNGVVSNDALLDLLYLALSTDASSTVKRAREMMRSRVEPLQLVSQLANLIMDILAGKFPDGVSDFTRKLLEKDNYVVLQHQLSHALKILSQTEKQLRTSKNQTTWLTVALLQLSSSHDTVGARLNMKMMNPPEAEFRSTSSICESLACSVACGCDEDEPEKTRAKVDEETLELVWSRAIAIFTPYAFRKFLRKHGKLVDIRLVHGTTVAEMEFDHPDHVSKAEKSWKVIASALQLVLGYNIELRINLTSNNTTKHAKFKQLYFNLFNCSRRVHLKKPPSSEERRSNNNNNNNNTSENSDSTPANSMRDKYVETCSSECGAHGCCHGKELLKTIRGKDGNALSTSSMARDDHKGCPNLVDTEPKREYGRITEYLKFIVGRKAGQPKHQRLGISGVHRTL